MKRRQPVNKFASAARFRADQGRTKFMNVKAVQRGGIRL